MAHHPRHNDDDFDSINWRLNLGSVLIIGAMALLAVLLDAHCMQRTVAWAYLGVGLAGVAVGVWWALKVARRG